MFVLGPCRMTGRSALRVKGQDVPCSSSCRKGLCVELFQEDFEAD